MKGTYSHHRVLLASLCSLGACPCPRCKIIKKQISEVGMKRDDAHRVHEARVDDDHYQHRVESAWRYIFQQGKGVKSTAVEDILSQDSYVPITASNTLQNYWILNTKISSIVEHILWEAFPIWLQRIFNACCRLTTWIRARSLESYFHTSHPYSGGTWTWRSADSQLPVSTIYIT